MQCPVDGTTLAMTDRQGVEIDYCPQCRGVWLDRGELDKLMAKEPERPRYRDDDDDDDDRRVGGHVGSFGGGHKRKRKGFLSEIFEFGD